MALRLLLDLLSLLLDLNFFLVSSLVSALLWLLAAACSLPAALLSGWEALLLSLCSLARAASCAGLSALQGLLRGCSCSLEGFKALGNLVLHQAVRGRELVQRGLCGALSAGQALGRQLAESVAIGTSLLAYLVNSFVNVCLIGTQNLFTLAVALWDSLAGLCGRVVDVAAACLAHVSSGAIALSILLWSPCQMVFKLLASATELFIKVFFVNIYGLGLLLLIIVVGTFVLNPGLLRPLTTYVLDYFDLMPSSHRRRRLELYLLAFMVLAVAVTSQTWRSVVNGSRLLTSRNQQLTAWRRQLTNWSQQVTSWSRQVISWSRRGRTMNQESNQRRASVLTVRPLAFEQLLEGQIAQPRPALSRRAMAGQHHHHPREEPSSSRGKALRKQQLNAAAKDDEGAPDNNPWMLLKEQEERKKCVICQDQTKTVVLLPCRHLCLCEECTEVLLQQAVYQRNCPLCRQMILQTLNVYL
ncbi:E3 ubiquitin-protein ligase RNF26 [Cuculus canorus]|uniref:E3 ubiquitin-protein ligase RNF26 n=1 Tax=Cuculus canorus TaxID=55661 RepID=UPI0023AB1D08|nr:E3 ubiquitin-protein ligase RNF26 [Cuculus canorus]